MLHDDRERAESFGADPAQYDRARPGYPPELISAVLAGGATEVLDVGCGTGIAARMIAEQGCSVLGVEPDARMADVARRHGIAVEQATFERWEDAGRQFDLMFAAQAWHLVEPVAGAAKVARLLREGGKVGLCWNTGHPPPEVKQLLDAVYAEHAPELEKYSVLLGNTGSERFADTARSLRETGALCDVRVETFGHNLRYTTSTWLDQLATHSDHRSLSAERLEPLLDAVAGVVDSLGGAFDMHYETVLITAHKRVL